MIRRNGFTLIEMLFVLSIFLLLCTLSLRPISSLLTSQAEQNYLQEISSAILLAQTAAITHDAPSKLTFTSHMLTVDYADGRYEQLETPHSLSFDVEKSESFSFQAQTGKINRFRTLLLTGTKDHYQLVFQIGKGRFYIEKN
ncbi:competence type IV pilus minor pilin ComGD [Listeria costaricensis]|uniref:competence type IV pilus minor pilin ComGD n=1 Tax=Listeria costaricensis TaxID=2026604 RepID=UPI000C080336|nr:competence type IV pilus minor pilin ComGD [Listeria costaricensis]